jgi:hypothetical protein
MIEAVAVAAVAALAPYLKALGTRVAEGAGDAIAERIVPLVKALRDRLRRDGDAEAEAELDRLAEMPDDEGRRAALAATLTARAEADPDLARLLQSIADASGGDTSMRVDVSGEASVGKIVQARDVGEINL